MNITPTIGNNCRAVALSTVLSYYGYPFSEAFCFGVGEAFDFSSSDIHFGLNRNYKCFSGNNENDIYTLAGHLKLAIDVSQPKTKTETRKLIESYIKNDEPVIVRVAINKYMKYLSDSMTNNMEQMQSVFRIINGSAGNHVTVISNTGKDKVLLHEPNIMEPVIISWDCLLDAMNPKDVVVRHPGNTIFHLRPTLSYCAIQKHLSRIISNSIYNTMFRYLYGESDYFGIKQVENFQNFFFKETNQDTYSKNAVLFRFFCDIVSGGGFYRRLYGRFLKEANEQYIHDSEIGKLYSKYYKLSKKWSTVSKEIVQNTNVDAAGASKLYETTLVDIAKTERELAERLLQRSGELLHVL
ncbi:MAG TPA: hypothetical protein DCW90_14580 [Lachnospiraceae bacterium]|nr:DUF4872 domain-containing protein [uncultured Lachnoclostridium sp.]HAU86660.1 hypothetical protein [Lachnospiraceae bacterium]